MGEIALSLVADYGVPIVFLVTFLSCLAVPVPSSLLMMAAGGFAAAGDLSLIAVAVAAFTGAVLGDNTGYWIARRLGQRASDWIDQNDRRRALKTKAGDILDRRGGPSVFLTCWLFAPLGPTMNYVCGLTKFSWGRFVAWGMAGEVVWVSIYVGLGFSFADNITALASLLGNASGAVTALVVVVLLGLWLLRAARHRAAPA
ncbi:DedA family protein [Pseudooctadecabacter sp.]|uniref:DedA family protein n=1 Tax=Pseudooctadecabacter sp. TaxID=1966338 RepID=UPI0035C7C675